MLNKYVLEILWLLGRPFCILCLGQVNENQKVASLHLWSSEEKWYGEHSSSLGKFPLLGYSVLTGIKIQTDIKETCSVPLYLLIYPSVKLIFRDTASLKTQAMLRSSMQMCCQTVNCPMVDGFGSRRLQPEPASLLLQWHTGNFLKRLINMQFSLVLTRVHGSEQRRTKVTEVDVALYRKGSRWMVKPFHS